MRRGWLGGRVLDKADDILSYEMHPVEHLCINKQHVTGLLPCPWPGCPKGSNGVYMMVANVPGEEPMKMVRVFYPDDGFFPFAWVKESTPEQIQAYYDKVKESET